jgi:hypothetical protein
MAGLTDLPSFAGADPGARLLGEHARAHRTRLSLPADLPLEDWQRVGQEIVAIADASAWWLGDWLVYGQNRFPERYRRAVAGTGLSYQTLRNYAWVARKFDASSRRPGLSIQHHAEVAGLSPGDRDIWLDRAERFGWSRSRLRQHLRASRASARRDDGGAGRETLVRVTVDQSRVDRWRRAAALSGRSLDDWAAGILDEAADETGHSA